MEIPRRSLGDPYEIPRRSLGDPVREPLTFTSIFSGTSPAGTGGRWLEPVREPLTFTSIFSGTSLAETFRDDKHLIAAF